MNLLARRRVLLPMLALICCARIAHADTIEGMTTSPEGRLSAARPPFGATARELPIQALQNQTAVTFRMLPGIPSGVTGKLRNDSKQRFAFVSVSFADYDDKGVRVATTDAFTTNLDPGETWEFMESMESNSVVRVELKDVRWR